MTPLRFQQHGRIQEIIAEELGFFKEVGLAYEVTHRGPSSGEIPPLYAKLTSEEPQVAASVFRDFVLSTPSTNVASTSCWSIATAVSMGYGTLWPHAYSIMPAGIYVTPDSQIEDACDLAKVKIVVGQHSGSHFSALYALQSVVPPTDIRFDFVAGRIQRLEYLLNSRAEAGSIYGVESYVLEQRGFRKVIDTSFIVNFMVVGQPAITDVNKYFEALRLAQRAIDENPHRYKNILARELPNNVMLASRIPSFGIGERLVFDSYSRESFVRARNWVIDQDILPKSWTRDIELER